MALSEIKPNIAAKCSRILAVANNDIVSAKRKRGEDSVGNKLVPQYDIQAMNGNREAHTHNSGYQIADECGARRAHMNMRDIVTYAGKKSGQKTIRQKPNLLQIIFQAKTRGYEIDRQNGF